MGSQFFYVGALSAGLHLQRTLAILWSVSGTLSFGLWLKFERHREWTLLIIYQLFLKQADFSFQHHEVHALKAIPETFSNVLLLLKVLHLPPTLCGVRHLGFRRHSRFALLSVDTERLSKHFPAIFHL